MRMYPVELPPVRRKKLNFRDHARRSWAMTATLRTSFRFRSTAQSVMRWSMAEPHPQCRTGGRWRSASGPFLLVDWSVGVDQPADEFQALDGVVVNLWVLHTGRHEDRHQPIFVRTFTRKPFLDFAQASQ